MHLAEDGAKAVPSRTRRRGAELEKALLDAAWTELREHGYAGLTYEGIAERAATSRTVVYRRWPTKQEIVVAALRQRREAHPLHAVDTGSLRGDLLFVLGELNDFRADLVALFAVGLGAYFEETGSSLGELRDRILSGGVDFVMDTILARAEARGELVASEVPPRVASLPFDLIRAELLMSFKPLPASVIEEIVDLCFLPLVRA